MSSRENTSVGNLDVLIVDDSAVARKIARSILAQMGIVRVQEAEDGEGALRSMRSWRPGLVLSDFDMTPMNGMDLLVSMRGHPRLQRVPFVMLTPRAVRFAEAARDDGLTHYLSKPYGLSDLRDKVMAAVYTPRQDEARPAASRRVSPDGSPPPDSRTSSRRAS